MFFDFRTKSNSDGKYCPLLSSLNSVVPANTGNNFLTRQKLRRKLSSSNCCFHYATFNYTYKFWREIESRENSKFIANEKIDALGIFWLFSGQFWERQTEKHCL